MTITIPPSLEWVAYLTGSEWPEGDEDAMFRIGDHWGNSANDLATLIPSLNQVRTATVASLTGDTSKAADEQFKMLFDGEYSVDKLVNAMGAVGDLARDQGTQIEYTKLQILSTLAITAAEIAWAIYNSWETLGASLSWIPTFEAFSMAVIRQIGREFLRRIAVAAAEAATKSFATKALKMVGKAAIEGTAIGLGQELAIQWYQEQEGHRHGINWEQVAKVGIGAAVGGGVGAAVHGPLATAFGPSKSVLGKAFTGGIVAYGSGVAGGLGGGLAAGGGIDGLSIFGGAAANAPSGVVHGAAAHGGDVHPGGEIPDGGPVKVPPPKVDPSDIDIKPGDVDPDGALPEPPSSHANDEPSPDSIAGSSAAGQNSGVVRGASAGTANASGDGTANGVAQDSGAAQGNTAGQQDNTPASGRNTESAQNGASQAGTAQNNGAGQQDSSAPAGQRSAQGSEGSRSLSARPVAAGTDSRGAGATQVAAAPHADTPLRDTSAQSPSSRSAGAPATTETTVSATAGPRSNSASEAQATSTPDAGRDVAKPGEKDQPSQSASANPRKSSESQLSKRTADDARSQGATDPATPQTRQQERPADHQSASRDALVIGGDVEVPAPPAPPPPSNGNSDQAPRVRGGGAPPKLDAPLTRGRGRDVLDDESWRHDSAPSAHWFAPRDSVPSDIWVSRRDDAHVRSVDTVVADIRTESSPGTVTSYQGLIRYDLRRIEVAPKKFVQDYTLKVHLTAGLDVDKAVVAAVAAKATAGVDGLLNQGFRLPSGDQFHMTVEFTDNPADAHTTVTVGDAATDQTHWNPRSSAQVLAHEALHYLGVPDEYADAGRVLLRHDTNSGVHQRDGGMMGRDVLDGDVGLRPRHLWIVERTARSQVSVPDTRLENHHASAALPPTLPRTPNTDTPIADTRPAPTAGSATPQQVWDAAPEHLRLGVLGALWAESGAEPAHDVGGGATEPKPAESKAAAKPSEGQLQKPIPQLPARIGDDLVLGGLDVVETFDSGDGALDYVEGLVRRAGGDEVWAANRAQITATFSDLALQPKVPGYLRGGRGPSLDIKVGPSETMTISLDLLVGAGSGSSLEFKNTESNYEFEHTSDPTTTVGSFADRRVVRYGLVQGNVSHAKVGATAAVIVSKTHDQALTEQSAHRQISGGQTNESATRFHGSINARITHSTSSAPEKISHPIRFHTEIGVPTRDVDDHGTDDPDETAHTSGSDELPRVKYTHALSGSDVVTNLWLLPDDKSRTHGEPAPQPRPPTRGPERALVTDFLDSKPMLDAFAKAYGESAGAARDETLKWLTVERLQANLHGMTNKQPLVLGLSSVPGARMMVHAFIEPLGTSSDRRFALPKRMMRPTGTTNMTEFHYGTEADTTTIHQDANTWSYQLPIPGRVRGQDGSSDSPEGGVDGTMTRGFTHNETQSVQYRTRNTVKNPVAGQAWRGQVRLRFEMHTPKSSPTVREAIRDQIALARRSAHEWFAQVRSSGHEQAAAEHAVNEPLKKPLIKKVVGAVHETRARFDVMMEQSKTYATDTYVGETVWAPPSRIWTDPPAERNSVAKSPWWRPGVGHRTVLSTDSSAPPRPAYAPPTPEIKRGKDGSDVAALKGLGGMDRVTNLDLSGFHGLIESIGRRAFGFDWGDVRSGISNWYDLHEVRSALPAMTQSSALTHTNLSGPGSKTTASLTANMEKLTFVKVFNPLSSPSAELTEGSAVTVERTGQVSGQGAFGGRGGDVNDGMVLGEAIGGLAQSSRGSERIRDQRRMAVGTKFDQPMALFEGWVRIDGTMVGSVATVHDSGVFPVEIAIPLSELEHSRKHDYVLPPSFTKAVPRGFIDGPSTPAKDTSQPADAPEAKDEPRSSSAGSQAQSSSDAGSSDITEVRRSQASDAVPASSVSRDSPPQTMKWDEQKARDSAALPKPPDHAFLPAWHPADELIAVDPVSGLAEAIRHDLRPALGTALDDAMDGVTKAFGPDVLAARLVHESGQRWSHDIRLPTGTITVKVEPVRDTNRDHYQYVGSAKKFETDMSVESQTSSTNIVGEAMRTVLGGRVQVPIPHGSVSGQLTNIASTQPGTDSIGESEHRIPLRVRTTEESHLFRQPIGFKISYEQHGGFIPMKGLPAAPDPVWLSGVFSYPKDTPTALETVEQKHIDINQRVVTVRPPIDAASDSAARNGAPANERGAKEDLVGAHILDSIALKGRDAFGAKWPNVRAELVKHVNTISIQEKLSVYTRGGTDTIHLESVPGTTVVLGAHLERMSRAGSKPQTEFYSGGQQSSTAGVANPQTSFREGQVQAQGDVLPTGSPVNLSVVGRVTFGVGTETNDVRTESAGTGTLFRVKGPAPTHVGVVKLEARMNPPTPRSVSGGDGDEPHPAAQLTFVTRESTPNEEQAKRAPLREIVAGPVDKQASHGEAPQGQPNPSGIRLPAKGLSRASIVKIVDGREFRSETHRRIDEKLKSASSATLNKQNVGKISGRINAGLTEIRLERHLPEMTRVDGGEGVELFKQGSLRITGRAQIKDLPFAANEPKGGNVYVLNDANQTRVHQVNTVRQGGWRLLFGPHLRFAGVQATLLGGGGVTARRRFGQIHSQNVRVGANVKFPREYTRFDGTTGIELTVHDGENKHVLPAFDVHGPILIPRSETDTAVESVEPAPSHVAPAVSSEPSAGAPAARMPSGQSLTRKTRRPGRRSRSGLRRMTLVHPGRRYRPRRPWRLYSRASSEFQNERDAYDPGQVIRGGSNRRQAAGGHFGTRRPGTRAPGFLDLLRRQRI